MIDDAVSALKRGELVIYPTETVYGLGADALERDAVERVFQAKDRSRDEPVSLAVPDVDAALRYTHPSSDAVEFMREFLPGPVTAVVPKEDTVPDVLTAQGSDVGVRVPSHDVALDLLREFSPITSTSANLSGNPSARSVTELDDIKERVSEVLDGGRTEYGIGSTVVDTTTWSVVREGALADEVGSWIERRGL